MCCATHVRKLHLLRRSVVSSTLSPQVLTTNAYMLGMLAILAACTIKLGPLAMINLYLIPYWINVVWLDVVTYLHHHGSHDANEQMPWYRGEVRAGNKGGGP